MKPHPDPKQTTSDLLLQANEVANRSEEEGYEPDSSECQLLDKFYEALRAGKGLAAAVALVELNFLEGFVLEELALLLEDSVEVNPHFLYRLQFKRRQRGRPKRKADNAIIFNPEDKFTRALELGDGAEAATALREMKQLTGGAVKVLAQLLEDSAELESSFQYRLLFKRRRKGRPYDPLHTGASALGLSFAIRAAKLDLAAAGEPPRMKSAVFDAGKNTSVSRATLFRALRRTRPQH